MDQVLRGLPFVFVYLDDVLIASRDPLTHLQHIRAVLKRLDDYGIVINKSKCVFGVAELDYLGHRINADGITPLPDRVTAILAASEPRTAKGLRRFLGQVAFYHRFIPGAAAIMTPLNDMLRGKATDLLWSDASRTAFREAKKALADATLLFHPSDDSRLALHVDASDIAIGAALMEFDRTSNRESHGEAALRPLGFFSQKLTDRDKRYSAFDRELLAL